MELGLRDRTAHAPPTTCLILQPIRSRSRSTPPSALSAPPPLQVRTALMQKVSRERVGAELEGMLHGEGLECEHRLECGHPWACTAAAAGQRSTSLRSSWRPGPAEHLGTGPAAAQGPACLPTPKQRPCKPPAFPTQAPTRCTLCARCTTCSSSQPSSCCRRKWVCTGGCGLACLCLLAGPSPCCRPRGAGWDGVAGIDNATLQLQIQFDPPLPFPARAPDQSML